MSPPVAPDQLAGSKKVARYTAASSRPRVVSRMQRWCGKVSSNPFADDGREVERQHRVAWRRPLSGRLLVGPGGGGRQAAADDSGQSSAPRNRHAVHLIWARGGAVSG